MSDKRVRSFKSSTPDYHRAFQTFLDHTDQKERALGWLEREVKRLPNRSVLIDAGAGNGKLTQSLSRWFESVVGIEQNATLLEDFATACPKSERILATILESSPRTSANFVLCSHVFYYISKDEWAANARQLINWLAPKGVLAIALQNPSTDCMRMVDHFIGGKFNLADLASIADDLEEGVFDVSVETVKASIRTQDLKTACDIAEFILNVLPMPNPPLWSDLELYVAEHFSKEDGSFEWSCHQDFLRVERHA